MYDMVIADPPFATPETVITIGVKLSA